MPYDEKSFLQGVAVGKSLNGRGGGGLVRYLYYHGTQLVTLDGTPNLPNGNWDGATPAAVFGASDITLQQSASRSTLWRLSGVASESKVDITNYAYINVRYTVTQPMIAGSVKNRGIVEISSDAKGFRNAQRSGASHAKTFDIATTGTRVFSFDISQYTGQQFFTVIVYSGQGDGDTYAQFAIIKIHEIWLSNELP